MTEGYWNRLRRHRLSRRAMLSASAKAGVGAAGLALVGCGDDDDDDDGAAAAAQDASAASAAAAAGDAGDAAAAAERAAQAAEAAAAAAAAVGDESAAAVAEAAAAAAEAAAEAAREAGSAEAAAAAAAAADAAAAAEAAAAAAQEAAEAATGGVGLGLDPEGGIIGLPDTQLGGKVRTVFWGRIANFDQHVSGNRGILSQMYETAVRANPLDGLKTIIPRLASGWEISDGGLTYTLPVRQGVTYHDGTPFVAGDLAASLRRMRNLGEFSDYTSRYATDLDYMESADAIDDQTVVVKLNAPRAYFLEMLAGPEKAIYSETHLQDTSNIEAEPLPGTGPYLFQEHRAEELTRFTRNPNYWNPSLPYIDELEMLHVRPWPDRATAILGGQADYANIVPAEFYDTRDQFADVAGVARHDGTRASLQFYIHNEKEPFNDPRVRRAIFLAPNRPGLIDVYTESMSLAGSRWVSNSSPVATPIGELEQIPGYRGEDPEAIAEAKQLLDAVGLGDGFDGGQIVSNTNPAHSEILAPAFQAELKEKLNIDTVLDPRGGSGRTEAYQEGTYDFLLGVIFRAPVSEFVTAWKSCIRTGGSNNFELYSNPEVDDIIDRIDAEFDFETKKDLYAEGMDLLDQDPPFYLVAFTQHNAMWANRLHGHLEEIRGYTEEGTWDLFWVDA